MELRLRVDSTDGRDSEDDPYEDTFDEEELEYSEATVGEEGIVRGLASGGAGERESIWRRFEGTFIVADALQQMSSDSSRTSTLVPSKNDVACR